MEIPPAAEARLKRLLFRSRHRGMKETDRLLGGFAERHASTLSGAQVARFEALLDESDLDVFDWIIGRRPVPPAHDTDVMALLKKFKDDL